MSWGFKVPKSLNLDAAKSALNASLNVVEQARSQIDKALDIKNDENTTASPINLPTFNQSGDASSRRSQSREDASSKNLKNSSLEDGDPGLSLSELNLSEDHAENLSKIENNFNQKINLSKQERENLEKLKFDEKSKFREEIQNLNAEKAKTILASSNDSKLSQFYSDGLTSSLLGSFLPSFGGNSAETEANFEAEKADLRNSASSREKLTKTVSNQPPKLKQLSAASSTTAQPRTISSDNQPIFAAEQQQIRTYIQGVVEDERLDFLDSRKENLDQLNLKIDRLENLKNTRLDEEKENEKIRQEEKRKIEEERILKEKEEAERLEREQKLEAEKLERERLKQEEDNLWNESDQKKQVDGQQRVESLSSNGNKQELTKSVSLNVQKEKAENIGDRRESLPVINDLTRQASEITESQNDSLLSPNSTGFVGGRGMN